MKKRLLFLTLVLSSIITQAQVKVQRTGPGVYAVDAHSGNTYTMKIPVRPDTTTALAQAAVDSVGLIFEEASTGKLWLRVAVSGGRKWKEIASSGGASIDTSGGLFLYGARNLGDLPNPNTARTNLGLGTSAVKDVPSSGDASSVQVVQGNDSRLAAVAIKVNKGDSTLFASFGRLYKTIDSMNIVNAIYLKKIDSALGGYLTFARAYKIADSLSALMLNKGDSANYSTFQRLYKVRDSLFTVVNNLKITNAGGAPSIQEGTAAGRPSAGTAGSIYISTDTKIISRDNGSSWDDLGSSSASGVTKAGPSPYITKVASDSFYYNQDSVAYSLGLSRKKLISPWQYMYTNDWSNTTTGSGNTFVVTGVTASMVGRKVNISSSAVNYTQRYQLGVQSYFENVDVEDTIVLTSTPAANHRLATGIDNIANMAALDVSNGANAGKLYLVNNTTDKAVSSTALTFAMGDTLVIKWSQRRENLSGFAKNLANGTTATVAASFPNALQIGNTDSIHIRGQFSIWARGGAAGTIQGWRITCYEPQGGAGVNFGDSKLEGGYSNTWDDRATDKLKAMGVQVIQLGASGDQISDMKARIQDVISLRPSWTVLQGYSNTIRGGATAATAIAQYDELKDALEVNNIKCFVLTLPETSSIAAQMALFDSTARVKYPTEYVDGVYDAEKACGAPCLTADGIHLTTRGNDTLAKYLYKKINAAQYNINQPVDALYRTDYARTRSGLLSIGGNIGWTAQMGQFNIGQYATARTVIWAGPRSAQFGYSNLIPNLRFTSGSGLNVLDIWGDSLSNLQIGRTSFASAPTSSNATLIGNGVAATAAAGGYARVTAIGAFALNGAGSSNLDHAGAVAIGYEAGYENKSPGYFYVADKRDTTLIYGRFTTGQVYINPPYNGAGNQLTFPTLDKFIVNGSGYFLDTLRLGKVPDGNLATDSVLLSSNNGSGNIRTVKKIAISTLLSGAGGTNYQTVQSNGSNQTQRAKLNFSSQFTTTDNSGNNSTDISLTSVTTQSPGDNSTKPASTAYVDAAVGALTFGHGTLAIINDADYTVGSGVENVIYQATLTANRTVTLPAASSNTNRVIRVCLKGPGGNQLIITSSSQIFMTGTSSSTSQVTNVIGYVMDFQSDGTSWYLTGTPKF